MKARSTGKPSPAASIPVTVDRPIRILAGEALVGVITATGSDVTIRTEPGWKLERATITLTIIQEPTK